MCNWRTAPTHSYSPAFHHRNSISTSFNELSLTGIHQRSFGFKKLKCNDCMKPSCKHSDANPDNPFSKIYRKSAVGAGAAEQKKLNDEDDREMIPGLPVPPPRYATTYGRCTTAGGRGIQMLPLKQRKIAGRASGRSRTVGRNWKGRSVSRRYGNGERLNTNKMTVIVQDFDDEGDGNDDDGEEKTIDDNGGRMLRSGSVPGRLFDERRPSIMDQIEEQEGGKEKSGVGDGRYWYFG